MKAHSKDRSRIFVSFSCVSDAQVLESRMLSSGLIQPFSGRFYEIVVMSIFCMYFLVFLYLFGAAVSDKRTGKIPNRYLWLWMVIFLAEAVWKQTVFSYALGFLAVLGLFFPLFFFHMMGAGDIKLMALLGAVFGVYSGLEIIFSGLFCSAVWSLFYLVRKRIFLKRIRYFLNYVKELAEYAEVIRQGHRPPPYFDEVRDGREAAFCFAPFLLAGYLLWLCFYLG